MSRSEYVKRTVITLSLVGLSLLIWKLSGLLLLAFGSMVFAASLVTLGLWVSKRTFLNAPWAVGAICLLLLLVTVGFWVVAVPVVADQLEKLSPQILQSWQGLKTSVLENSVVAKNLPQGLTSGIDEKKVLKKSLEFVSGTFGALGSLLLLAILSLYFALAPHENTRGALKLVFPQYRDRVDDLLTKLRLTLSWWLGGRVLSMLVVSVFTLIGLWIIDLELALILALFAGLLSFIPNIGPVLSVLPAALVAFSHGATQLLWVIVVYVVVQLIESYLITPLIQKRATSLPPVLLLLTQVAMGLLFGLWGILFASPALACILVLLKEAYIKPIEQAK